MADRWIAPPEHAQYFSEKLMQMPECFLGPSHRMTHQFWGTGGAAIGETGFEDEEREAGWRDGDAAAEAQWAALAERRVPNKPSLMLYMYVCLSVCVCISLYLALAERRVPNTLTLTLYMHVCLYVCMYINVHICTCIVR